MLAGRQSDSDTILIYRGQRQCSSSVAAAVAAKSANTVLQTERRHEKVTHAVGPTATA